ncbi:MAG TPA: thioredoxin [Candidatus Pullilachnospira gallistercoris]|uniref:Thioredoxin n=1 Tax=Candidatus Pullilachnospira gallistercoris TaxID=2840911 RepID=A0A9D1E8J5_9FIRM|nr:thioredoxin [Candidatus Pullilachnospira gallistercoris]
MEILHVTEANFDSQVLQADKPVLVDFWATWCGPCQMQAPILEELAKERDDVIIAKVDVDQNPNLAQKYRVMSIPMLAVFKNGQPVVSAVGLQNKATLNEMLNQ